VKDMNDEYSDKEWEGVKMLVKQVVVVEVVEKRVVVMYKEEEKVVSL
jgi:hypothetical protein